MSWAENLAGFVADSRVRHLYDLLFARVRHRAPISFPYRCDGPHVRRFLEMRIEPEDQGHLRMWSRTLEIELRDSIWLPSAPSDTTDE